MATYDELNAAAGNAMLQQRIAVACAIAADGIRSNAAATAAQKAWAKTAFVNPHSAMLSLLWSVLAQNKSATLAQITGATDAAIQNAVDASVALLSS